MVWNHPQEIDPITLAFPSSVIGTLLPNRDDIPDEFWKRGNFWARFVSHLFFFGGELPRTKPGVDPHQARSHLQAVLRSFEPQHQHKEAGAAYLMSLWYEQPQEQGA